MNSIGINEKLLEKFTPELSLLGSRVIKIEIAEENLEPVISIDFVLVYPSGKKLRIVFKGISEYYFFHDKTITFYYVERLKLFNTSDAFYVSLDPYDESGIVHENDNDFILCTKIEGFE